MNKQTEALRLADALDADATNGDMGRKPDPKCHKRQAAAELRRLHQALAEQPVQQEPVALEQERKAFEEWIDSSFINKGHAAFHKFSDRDAYCIDEIQNKWKAWKERAKRAAPQPAQPQLAATITISQRGPVHTIDNHFEDCVRDWPDGEYKLYTSPQPAPVQQEHVATLFGSLPVYDTPSPAQPEWIPITQELLNNQHPWLYQPMWIVMKHCNHLSLIQGCYEWQQGRYPDRFLTDIGNVWAFDCTHVMPIVKPTLPAIEAAHNIKENT